MFNMCYKCPKKYCVSVETPNETKRNVRIRFPLPNLLREKISGAEFFNDFMH